MCAWWRLGRFDSLPFRAALQALLRPRPGMPAILYTLPYQFSIRKRWCDQRRERAAGFFAQCGKEDRIDTCKGF